MSNWTAAALLVGTGATTVALASHAFPASTSSTTTASSAQGTAVQTTARSARERVSCHVRWFRRDRDHDYARGERQDRCHAGQAPGRLPRQLVGVDSAHYGGQAKA